MIRIENICLQKISNFVKIIHVRFECLFIFFIGEMILTFFVRNRLRKNSVVYKHFDCTRLNEYKIIV